MGRGAVRHDLFRKSFLILFEKLAGSFDRFILDIAGSFFIYFWQFETPGKKRSAVSPVSNGPVQGLWIRVTAAAHLACEQRSRSGVVDQGDVPELK